MADVESFLKGKPITYTGFDGRLYVATFYDVGACLSGQPGARVGAGFLEIADYATGDIIRERVMGREMVSGFFLSLDRQAEG